jgi:L-threonylcarbamoyladenylate synthase
MTTELLHTTPHDITRAAGLLREGALVAFPTETVYGLGANALDEEAVRRVYEVKGRPKDNPMIVHVHTVPQARELMQVVPALFEELTNEFWPGPLTLIVRHNAAVPDIVTAGLDTVALRMPDHSITRQLLQEAGIPVAAPSANISGRPSPTDARTVYEELQGRIAAVLDGGECPVGIESTVLDLTTREPVILRPGTVTREDLEDVIQSRVHFIESYDGAPRSPGTKYRHYAPRVLLRILSHDPDPASMDRSLRAAVEAESAAGRRVGLLAPERWHDTGAAHFYSLNEGRAVDYARLLYTGLRTLDECEVDVILCPGIEAVGVGYAVMNRLLKAGEEI